MKIGLVKGNQYINNYSNQTPTKDSEIKRHLTLIRIINIQNF